MAARSATSGSTSTPATGRISTPTISTRRHYPVDFEWQGVKVRNSGIRVRGNTTRNDHKPSFRIDFNRYVSGQDFFGLNAIVLNNAWHDPSMLHDRLSMLTFRRVGIPAPRQAHVRLFVGAGHEYAGVYAISEEVSKTFLAENFGEDNGYLYEFHHQDGENYGFEDPGPDLGWYIPRFGPKTHETESVANLYMPIRNLVEAVNDAPRADLRARSPTISTSTPSSPSWPSRISSPRLTGSSAASA